jgi:CheY-like chemotaxis protein
MGHVLVVDDDEDVCKLTQDVFEKKGFSTEAAGDGLKALEQVDDRRPDLILLDLDMPRLDGWGFLERLQGFPDPPPVVFMSGNLSFEAFARGARAGVAAFFRKPIHFTEMVTSCERILDSAARAGSASDDRRSQPRRPLLVGLNVVSKRGTPRVPGELSDLSRAGAQVNLMIPVEVGARVRITLDSSLTGALIKFEGEVRWCAPVGEGYALGVEMLERSPEADQLLDHLLDESA